MYVSTEEKSTADAGSTVAQVVLGASQNVLENYSHCHTVFDCEALSEDFFNGAGIRPKT